MIIDQLFEDEKKKKLNEVDPRNFDSDEDYYDAVRGRSSDDDDYDYDPDLDDIDDEGDDESYYEKYVRTKNLESRQGVAEGHDNADDYQAKAQWLRQNLHVSPDEAWEMAYDTDPDTWVGSPWEDDYKSNIARDIESFSSDELFNKVRIASRKAIKQTGDQSISSITVAVRSVLPSSSVTKKIHSPRSLEALDNALRDEGIDFDELLSFLDKKAQYWDRKDVAESRQRKLNEAMLMEDPIYRQFKTVGRYIVEYKMSEKQILDLFAQAEAGMTDKATGANRTMLGRGKDTATDFAGGVANALKGVWAGIQNSVPVAAVDVAYDQATDALAGLTGGQKGSVMQAIKKYRNLAKQYPKTAGLAKGALVAITGLATGGAGLPAIAALVYGLDSAIKGEKASDIALKAGGAAATAWAGQKIASALSNQPAGAPQAGGDTGGAADAASTAAGAPMGGGTYTIQNGDQLGYIAQANGVSVEDLRGLNPQIDFSQPLRPGMEIQLPMSGTPGQGSVWQGYQGGMYGDKAAVKESIKFKTIPAEQLIDQKLTVLSWALLESVGRKGNNIVLTGKGVYTVFENVDRYRKAVVMELKGVPGSSRPAFYRPDMPGGPGKTSKPGIIGRGLNWLDKTAGKVGGWLGNKAHQFTTGVTKEKLKMNWQQAGKPSDSDQLAAWLVTQGVPQQVVSDVYGKMGIPYTAPAAAEPAQAAAEPTQAVEPKASGRVGSLTGINKRGENRPYTGDELYALKTKDMAVNQIKQGAPDMISAVSNVGGAAGQPQATTSVTPTATPAQPATTAAAGTFPGEDPQGPNYIGRREVAKRQAARAAAQTAAPAKPNFAQQGGYAQVNQPTAVKYSGIPAVQPGAAAKPAPATPKVTTGGPTPAERQALDKRIAAAAKAQPVAETVKQVKRMMETVTTKADVQRVKDYIDYHMGSNLTESARLKRNRLISEVTQLAATRRRAIARQMS